jgi:hypothetical protein
MEAGARSLIAFCANLNVVRVHGARTHAHNRNRAEAEANLKADRRVRVCRRHARCVRVLIDGWCNPAAPNADAYREPLHTLRALHPHKTPALTRRWPSQGPNSRKVLTLARS